MNELRLRSNENDRENKKGLKKMRVSTYANKVLLRFLWLNYKNFMVKRALAIAIIYSVTF